MLVYLVGQSKRCDENVDHASCIKDMGKRHMPHQFYTRLRDTFRTCVNLLNMKFVHYEKAEA